MTDDGRVVRRPLASRTVQGLAVVATFLTGVAVVGLRAFGPSDPVTVDEAVRRFRESTPSVTPTATPNPTTAATGGAAPSRGPAPDPATTAPAAPAGPTRPPGAGPPTPPRPPDFRPAEGVYVYATAGHEAVDAMSGARHDYPAETTMTVRHTGCGLVGRWDASEDRWDETHECVSGGSSTLTRYVTFHRFFGQQQRKELTCGDGAYLRPPSRRPGYTWTFTCSGSGTTARTTGTIVGLETLAGERVLHVRATTKLFGSSRGDERRDYWLALDAPGLLRAVVAVDADEDTPFGAVRYTERYEIRLTSRTPRR